MSRTFDKETSEVIQKADRIKKLLESEGWQEAKAILDEKISLMESVNTIDFENKEMEEIGKQAMIRANSVALVRQWLAELDGIVDQFESNKGLVEDDLIIREPQAGD